MSLFSRKIAQILKWKYLGLYLVMLTAGCNSGSGKITLESADDLIEFKKSFVGVTPLTKWDGFGFTESPELLQDSIFQNAWVLVFSYYAVPVFRIEEKEGTVVKIPPVIAVDKEFIYNMTTKALDTNWLRTHVGPCCN